MCNWVCRYNNECGDGGVGEVGVVGCECGVYVNMLFLSVVIIFFAAVCW